MKLILNLGMIAATLLAGLLLFTQSAQSLNLNSPQLTDLGNLTLHVAYLEAIDSREIDKPEHPSHSWSQDCLILSGQQGIDACNLAIATNPNNSMTWNNRGYKLFRLGRYDEALLSYNHALVINPASSLVLANRCAVLSRLERYAEALTSCNLALEENSQWGSEGEALAWDNRGDALFNLERYEESLASFERALQCNPDYANARSNREVVLQKLSKPLTISYQLSSRAK